MPNTRLLFVTTSCLLLTACISVLPSAVQTTETPWKSYEEARQAFAQIRPGTTTREDLWAMGFNPFRQPNIHLLNYLEVTRTFLPNESIRLADLHPDIQTCLKARTECVGYEVLISAVERKRHGSVVLDVFNFQRKTRITGWQFRGLIVLESDKVIYKLESGQPSTLEHENKRNPLGPLQELSLPTPR